MAKEKIENPTQAQAFELWYSLGKDFKRTHETLRLNTPPIAVSSDTVYRWSHMFKWVERARSRDLAVSKKLSQDAIKSQVDFIKRKGSYGKLMQRRALEFFNRGIDPATGKPMLDPVTGKPIIFEHVSNAAVAVQVMQAGVLFEQASLGLPEWITEAMSADDETLRRIYETALAELTSITDDHDGEGSGSKTFPAVTVESVSEDSSSKG